MPRGARILQRVSSFQLVGRAPVPQCADARSQGALGPEQFPGVLVAAQAGAEWAWTILYRLVAGPVLGYLRAQGSREPEDLLGEVFVQVARSLARFEGGQESFRSWVFTIAHHRLIDERRRNRRRPADPVAEVPDRPGGSTEDEALGRLRDEDALRLLDALTPQQRDVVLLRVFADQSLQEVSRIVGRPVSAVKALQRRGLERLRKKMSQDPYPDDPPWR